jgi:hypothetical protein
MQTNVRLRRAVSGREHVLDTNTEIANRAFDLPVTDEDLDRTNIARAL